MRELVLALAGVLGDLFYQDSGGKVVLDPAFPLSPAERDAVSRVLPLAGCHHYLRGWVESEKRWLYLRALAVAVEEEVLRPLTERLLGLELRCGAMSVTEVRVALASELMLLPHVRQTVESLEQEGTWGPALLARLDACAQSGAAEVRAIYGVLRERTGRVLARQAEAWMTTGVLRDPCGEFFVQERADKTEQWERFEIAPSLVPRHLRPGVAEKVLLVGKCVRLLAGRGSSAHEDASGGGAVSLEVLVERLGGRVTQELWHKLFDECQLRTRLRQMRSLFLLDNGRAFLRFAQSPIWSLAPTRNAQRELNRCWRDCSSGAETVTWDGNYANGWDGVGVALPPEATAFPLSLVFTGAALASYQSIFQFLFKLLRTECALNSSWRELRQVSGYRHMSLLVSLLRRHVMDDVVAVEFALLEAELRQPRDFDFLLAAHGRFLSRVQSGVLLLSAPLRRACDEVLETVLAFCWQREWDRAEFGRQLTLFVDVLKASKLPGGHLHEILTLRPPL